MKPLITRRTALRHLSLAAGVGCALGRHPGSAYAAATDPLPHLDIHDSSAVALGYVEEASAVDAKRYPAFVAGSNCENCLQLQGNAGDTWRRCQLFPGKLVKISGWCTAWTAEM